MRTGWMTAVAATLTAMAGTAAAQTPLPPPPMVVTNPSWAAMPDAEAMAEALPGFVRMAEIDGDATLQCVVGLDGRLSLCEVKELTPTGLGFDRAALSLASRFRVNPRTVNGDEGKSSVQFTIHFRHPPEQAPPPWIRPQPSPEHLQAAVALLAANRDAVEAELEDVVRNLGVDADRTAKVEAIVRQVRGELVEQDMNASALVIARLTTPEQLARMAARQGPPPPQPSPEDMERAYDQVAVVAAEHRRRFKALYCAQFDCPVLASPPAGAIQP